jgi:hypothetical protein
MTGLSGRPARWRTFGFGGLLMVVAGTAVAQVPPQSGVPPLSGGQGGSGPTTHDEQHGTTLGSPPPRDGVIRPRVDPDPAMRQSPAVREAFPTPVIPPPGTPGGNPNTVAK